jgi:hypothetical protein
MDNEALLRLPARPCLLESQGDYGDTKFRQPTGLVLKQKMDITRLTSDMIFTHPDSETDEPIYQTSLKP